MNICDRQRPLQSRRQALAIPMLADMKIRPFQLSDFETIAGIYAASKLDELRHEEQQFELLPLEQDEKRLSGLMESQIYVCNDGRILGYGAVHDKKILALFVHPLARGQGIGSSLFEYLLTKVAEPAFLLVAKTNTPAKALYRRYGFTVIRELQTTYNGKSVAANEMARITNQEPGIFSGQ